MVWADFKWRPRQLRNSFAHPKEFNLVVTPGMAVDVFVKTVEIVNHLRWNTGDQPMGSLHSAQRLRDAHVAAV